MKPNNFISGPLASGKTTFANQLIGDRKALKIVASNIDISIKYKLDETIEVIVVDCVNGFGVELLDLLTNDMIVFRPAYAIEAIRITKPEIIVISQNPKLGVEFKHLFQKVYALGKDVVVSKTPALGDNFKVIIDKLENLKRKHFVNDDDCWYSCPKSNKCCNTDLNRDECNCGADKYNAEVDEIIKLISNV